MTNLENKTSELPTWKEIKKFVGISGAICIASWGLTNGYGVRILDKFIEDDFNIQKTTQRYHTEKQYRLNAYLAGANILAAAISSLHFTTTRIRRQKDEHI